MRKRRKHVLFVCIGNVCRSAMAEALARKYGEDVIVPSSAGIAPASAAHPLTRSILEEKNIDPGIHVPRRITDLKLSRFDLIVNMSGSDLPSATDVPIETWTVEDPIGRSEEFFRKTRDEIEMKVMRLILRMRTGKFDSQTTNSRQ